MEIATITRKYIFENGNNGSLELDDIDTNLSNENRISIAFNVMFKDFTEKMGSPRWKGNISLS